MPTAGETSLPVLIVGGGSYGRVHAERILADGSGCHVVGVCDPEDPEGLADLGIQGWRDLEHAIRATRPGLVSVVTPTWTHAAVAETAMAAGCRVLVEKPVAMNPQEAVSLAKACAEHGGWVDVVSQRRFQEGSRHLHECIAAGTLGTVSSAVGSCVGWRGPEYYEATWRGQRSLGGGNLLNQGMHLLDLMVWVFGPVRRSESFHRPNRHPGTDIDEACVGIVEFAQGVLAVVDSSLVARPGEPFRLEVRGDAGTAVLTDEGLALTLADAASGVRRTTSCDTAQALTNQYSEVASAIGRGGAPTVGIASARATLELAWQLSTPRDDGEAGAPS